MGQDGNGALLTVTSATTLGVLWEFYEWTAHELGSDIQVGYGDTLLDLAMDMSGSVVVGLVLIDRLRRRHHPHGAPALPEMGPAPEPESVTG